MVCKQRKVDSIFMGPTAHQIHAVKMELGEDDERLQHAELLVHQWIDCQLNLQGTYDKFMVRNYLRGSKHNLEQTKMRLENYFLAKYNYSEIFTNRNPADRDILDLLNNVNIVPLPKMTDNGERIIVFSLNSSELSFDMRFVAKLLFMIYDLLMLIETPVSGEIVIFDCAHLRPSDSVQFMSAAFRNLVSITRHAYAIRLKQIHIVNAPAILDKTMPLIKALLHDKVKKRFIVHKHIKSLHDHLTPATLPVDFHGSCGTTLQGIKAQWHQILIEYSEWFKERESIQINKKRNNTNSKCGVGGFQSHVVGLDGSFRRLNID